MGTIGRRGAVRGRGGGGRGGGDGDFCGSKSRRAPRMATISSSLHPLPSCVGSRQQGRRSNERICINAVSAVTPGSS